MLTATIVMEDTILTAMRDKPGAPGVWDVTIADTVTGKQENAMWQDAQIAAVVALMFGGDDCAGSAALYEVAESAVQGFSPECRPIP